MAISYVESVSPQVFLSHQGRGKARAAGERDVVGGAVVGEDVVVAGEERWCLEEDDVVDGNVSGELGDNVCLK